MADLQVADVRAQVALTLFTDVNQLAPAPYQADAVSVSQALSDCSPARWTWVASVHP
jgi:hypothetical protein